MAMNALPVFYTSMGMARTVAGIKNIHTQSHATHTRILTMMACAGKTASMNGSRPHLTICDATLGTVFTTLRKRG